MLVGAFVNNPCVVARNESGHVSNRVMRAGGELHITDFTKPSDPLMALAFRLVRPVDGLERTRVNARGQLGALVSEAGFGAVTEGIRFRTAFGTLGLMKAAKHTSGPSPTASQGQQ